MTKFKNANNDQAPVKLDDAVLDTVVGGAANPIEAYLTPQLALAYLPVGGWTMMDVFAKHTIGH